MGALTQAEYVQHQQEQRNNQPSTYSLPIQWYDNRNFRDNGYQPVPRSPGGRPEESTSRLIGVRPRESDVTDMNHSELAALEQQVLNWDFDEMRRRWHGTHQGPPVTNTPVPGSTALNRMVEIRYNPTGHMIGGIADVAHHEDPVESIRENLSAVNITTDGEITDAQRAVPWRLISQRPANFTAINWNQDPFVPPVVQTPAFTSDQINWDRVDFSTDMLSRSPEVAVARLFTPRLNHRGLGERAMQGAYVVAGNVGLFDPTTLTLSDPSYINTLSNPPLVKQQAHIMRLVCHDIINSNPLPPMEEFTNLRPQLMAVHEAQTRLSAVEFTSCSSASEFGIRYICARMYMIEVIEEAYESLSLFGIQDALRFLREINAESAACSIPISQITSNAFTIYVELFTLFVHRLLISHTSRTYTPAEMDDAVRRLSLYGLLNKYREDLGDV